MTLHLTFASNLWGTGCMRRLPQCGDCYVHLVNNYHNCPGNSVGMTINENCKALVENNFAASGVNSPLTGSGSNRQVTARDNNFRASSVGSEVTVPYQYTKIAAADVPANLTGDEGAGATLGNDKDYILSTIPVGDRGEATATWYSITGDDGHVAAGGVINEVGGITLTFSPDIKDWSVVGKGEDAQTVDGVELTGKCAQSSATNGAPIILTTTKAGTLTIFFGSSIANNKAINMKEGENGLTGKVLSTGAEVADDTAPNPAIDAWDGIVYELEANKTYQFKARGTKWRLAGFRYISTATGINSLKSVKAAATTTYNLAGQRVDSTYKGVVIKNGKKMLH